MVRSPELLIFFDMTYNSFVKIIKAIRDADEKTVMAYNLKIDLFDFVDPYTFIINDLLAEIYTQEGINWLEWFMYETDYGKMYDGAIDENGIPICFDFRSTYDYLNVYKK